jgi:hypothetical protein
MLFYIVIIAIAWLTFRHFAKKKRAADIRKWSVDFRKEAVRKSITSRLPWRNL